MAVQSQLLNGGVRTEFLTRRDQPPFFIHLPKGRQQAMTSLSRRLERLEAGCRQSFEIAPDRCRLIKQQALQHLTTDQLRCLINLKKTPPQGRPLTSEEGAVVRAFDTATKEECRKAGITVAEFLRYRRQATQP
jgi:hypothetical protein